MEKIIPKGKSGCLRRRKKESITPRQRIFPALGAMLVALICSCILYLGNNVGLSNNGDFARVLQGNYMSMTVQNDAHRYMFIQNYTMEVEGDRFFEQLSSVRKTNDEIYYSPHFHFVKASKVLNFISNIMTGRDVHSYNIAWLAAIYIAILAMSAWCIFTFFADKSRRVRIGVFLVFLFIFCDAGYVLYFNSLYGEPLQYLMAMSLISIGLMMYKRPSFPKAICFFVALYFFAGSKLANIPYSIIAAFLSIAMVFLRKDKLFKYGVVISALVCAASIGSLYGSIPDWMHYDTTYQSIFYGVLKDSDTVEEDLDELGIDKKYAYLANTHAYPEVADVAMESTDEQMVEDVYSKVGKFNVLMFYLKHPVRFVQKIAKSIEYSAYIRPPNMGNSSVETEIVTNRFSLWSILRVRLGLSYNPFVVFAVLVLLLIYVILIDILMFAQHKQFEGKNFYKLLSMNILVCGLWINMVLPILGNGEADLAKHMFLFVNCMDILFALGIITAIAMKPKRIVIAAGITALVCAIINISPQRETVTFGTYNQKPIEWEIFGCTEDNKYILVAKDIIDTRAFDGQSNHWESSDLREFLNTEFLAEFTQEEISKIAKTTNRNILSYDDRLLADGGNHTHVCNYVSKYVDDLGETAYHNYVSDLVFIPTPAMVQYMNSSESYWMLCPYASNGFMERYVNGDGFVLRAPVNRKLGIKPVLVKSE